ncbi:mitochondrial ribosome-associated GTPase 2 isoform 2-T2 [Cochliomyia hominivorax]
MSFRRFCLILKTQSKFFSRHTKLNPLDGENQALRSRKLNSSNKNGFYYFSDAKTVRTVGGKGGSGRISFLQLWCKERAGPDGGDGGNGGHVILEATNDVRNFNHISTIIRGEDARGGAGGKGNRFFTTDKENSPKVCEHGAAGEDIVYLLEMRSMADIGIIGFPNSGKSTLLNAISRTRSKVAPYPFTTIHPQIGMVQYAGYFQLAVADLPGIIPDSHCNRGLGIQFLKHVERCSALIYLLDASLESPWLHYERLIYEISSFNNKLTTYTKIIVANKIDKPHAKENLLELRKRIDPNIIGISAKDGTNLNQLLNLMRIHFEKRKS